MTMLTTKGVTTTNSRKDDVHLSSALPGCHISLHHTTATRPHAPPCPISSLAASCSQAPAHLVRQHLRLKFAAVSHLPAHLSPILGPPWCATASCPAVPILTFSRTGLLLVQTRPPTQRRPAKLIVIVPVAKHSPRNWDNEVSGWRWLAET